MHCPDCQSKVRSFEEYCKKCGADLNRSRSGIRRFRFKN